MRRAGWTQLAILGVAVAVAAPTAAEMDLGGAWLSGEIEAGGRIISGDFGSAAFDEYRSWRPGGIVDGWLLLEGADRLHYLMAEFDFQDEEDQSYALGLGRWGHYGVELDFSEFPHHYSNDSLTPYSRGFDGTLELPTGWDYANANADLQSELDANVVARNIEFRQLNGRANAFYRPHEWLELTAGYEIQDKHGTQPGSIGFGTPTPGFPTRNFVSIADRINEKTHLVTAAAKLARDRWSMSLDYAGSFFDNDLNDATVRNPLQETDVVGASAFGRKATAPDNSAHQVSLSGSALIPTSFPSRVAGTFSYGLRLQNEDFLPYTTNSALVSPIPGSDLLSTSSLPQTDLDGKVHTFLTNLVYTARPAPDWNLEARYRLYWFDNDTDQIRFPQRVPQDNEVSAGDFQSHAHEYRRQTANLKASWRVNRLATLRTGFGWENWDRSSDREVRHSNEYSGELGFDVRPVEDLKLLTTWRIGYRDQNNYVNLGAVELDDLRKFDVVGGLLRNTLDWRAVFAACQNLDLSLSGGLSYYDYDDSDFGLREDVRWNIGVGGDYVPWNWLSVSAWYSFDYQHTELKSMSRTPAEEQPDTDPDRIWRSKTHDHAHTAGVDVVAEVIPERLDLRFGYLLQLANAETNSGGGPNSGDPENFPDLEDEQHVVTTSLAWHVYDRIDLIAGYRYEEFDNQDFFTDDIGTNLGGTDIYLNNEVGDYTAHIVTLTARVEF